MGKGSLSHALCGQENQHMASPVITPMFYSNISEMYRGLHLQDAYDAVASAGRIIDKLYNTIYISRHRLSLLALLDEAREKRVTG